MDSAASNGPPWASMFDSVANMRALTAIQAEGFRAASKLVDRFVEVAATGRDAPGAGPAAPPLTEEQRANLWGATDVEPLISSWWSMVNQLVFGYPAAVSSTPAAAGAPVGPAALDLAGGVTAGRLELQATAGGKAVAEVWLHNRGLTDFGHVHLRCSDLQSDSGRVIGADAVKLDPEVVPMPGRSSRGIDIGIEVADDAQPGLYRGNLLTEGHPDLWLAVALTVHAPIS